MAFSFKAIANIFNRRQAEGVVRNAVNEAFLLGGTYTKYDESAPTYIREGYLYNPVVYAVAKQRSDKAVSIPYYIKEVKDGNSKKRLDMMRKTLTNGYQPSQYIKELTLKQAAFDEKFMNFPMARPNELQTWEEVIALYETFISTTGNFYLYLLRGDVTGIPAAVYVLPSHLMKIVTKPNAALLGVESPIESYMLIEGNQYIEFSAEDVIHIKLPNPDYDIDGRHLYGLSPLAAALRNIQSSNLGIDGNVRTMLNSGVFGFIQSSDPKIPLNDKQGKEIRSRLQEMDMSNQRLGKISALSLPIEFTRFSMGTDELKPFDFQDYDQKQIANVMGWDTKLLNDDAASTLDNYKVAYKRVVSNTMMPSLRLFQAAINDKFLPLFKGYDRAVFEFDFSELPEMQPDMKELVEWLNIGVANGAYTRDEFREMTNFAVKGTPEMEAHTVNQDIILLEEAVNNDFSLNGQAGISAAMAAVS